MTVAQLIALLQMVPNQNAPVQVMTAGNYVQNEVDGSFYAASAMTWDLPEGNEIVVEPLEEMPYTVFIHAPYADDIID